MGNLTYNSEIFTNVKKYTKVGNDISYTGIQIAGKLSQKNGQDYPLIDAIDIDWNRAWVSTLNTYINSTEDLVNLLNELNAKNDFNLLEDRVSEAETAISEIQATYVTQTYLGEVLLSYQNTLIAGNNIKIGEDNTIYTYDVVNTEELQKYTPLEDYTNEIALIWNNLVTIEQTREEITYYITEYVQDGVSQEFNTLNKIESWISNSYRYEKVNYTDMVSDGSVTYYRWDNINKKWVAVDQTFIDNNPTEQYYTRHESNADIQGLIDRIEKAEDKIGTYTSHGSVVTYTGMLKDIKELEYQTTNLVSEMSGVKQTATQAKEYAYVAEKEANAAKDYAEQTYNFAMTTYGLVVDANEKSTIAYNEAVRVSEAMGVPSELPHYEKATEDDKLKTGNNTIETTVLYIQKTSSTTGEKYYDKAVYDPNYKGQYYILTEEVLATGLNKRVEDVESEVGHYTERLEEAEKNAGQALYNLSAQSGNDALSLSLSPDKYEGSPYRTITVDMTECVVNSETGEVSTQGIATQNTLNQAFTYFIGWEILPCVASNHPAEWSVTTTEEPEYDIFGNLITKQPN